MNPAFYSLFMVLFLVLFVLRQRNRAIIAKKFIQNKKTKGNKEMFELAKDRSLLSINIYIVAN